MQRPSERAIVFLVGAVQFVNILDFMMVMPMGPDFARSLGIPTSHLGYIGGSYTAAASVAGLVGSLFLDRFDRRKALAVAMTGLVLGTAAGGFATGLGTLMAARVLAGFFGGPATSLSFSIIADVVPAERRGRAMGAVMGAFSAASVLGVPLGLEMARRYGWRAPFFSVAGLGALVVAGAIFFLPPLTLHLVAVAERARQISFGELLSRPLVRLSYLMTATVMMGGFILIPNISAYVQFNLGYPRDRIGLLYGVGGVVSFFATRAAGALLDRIGALRNGSIGVAILVTIIWVGFVRYLPGLPVLVIFVAFMLGNAFRNVTYNTLTSRVPRPHERARFLSLQSSIQHMASASGAFLSSKMLTEQPSGALEGVPAVALTSIGLALALPYLFLRVERGLRDRVPTAPEAAAKAA
jgi:predicted MFS family arabinose efflux permease